MTEPPIRRMYRAVLEGDVAAAREVLRQSPEVLHPAPSLGSWLYMAAGEDDLAMMEMLVEAGLYVNAEQVNGNNPLSNAARNGAVRAARWLLDRGGRIIPSGGLTGGTLIGAVNSGSLELVRLLIERGADVHGVHGSPPENALSHALMFGHAAIADLLRERGATIPGEGGAAPPSERERIVAHVEKYLGPVSPAVVKSIVSGEVDLQIHAVPPEDGRPFLTLFTTGMSSRAMPVPAGSEDLSHAELLIYLPADWPVPTERVPDAEHFWPVEWLRRVAEYPFTGGAWPPGDYAVISNGEPPQPLAPHVRFTSLLLLTNAGPLDLLRLDSGKTIRLYTIFPLYTEERDLVLAQGPRPLLERFHRQGIALPVDINRANVGVL